MKNFTRLNSWLLAKSASGYFHNNVQGIAEHNKPLSPALSPLVPRGEREKGRAVNGGGKEMRLLAIAISILLGVTLCCGCSAGGGLPKAASLHRSTYTNPV